MNRMLVGMAAALLLSMAGQARAEGNRITEDGAPVLRSEKVDLNIFGRAQMIGAAQQVPDPVRDHTRIYLFLKQARLGARGRYGDIKFESQFAFGGEDANGSNTDLSLMDFSADIPLRPLGDGVSLKAGQFRVPFGREGMTDRGYMLFDERSIANMATYQGRDYGLAIQKHAGTFAGAVGVFSSGGRDVPQRYLPEKLGVPEVALRIGYNDGVDEDIFHVVGTDDKLERTTKSLYFNGIYTKDTLIGHSTAIGVRTIDKNLLINPNYNPYIGTGPKGATANGATLSRGNLWYLGVDGTYRHPLGEGRACEGEFELDYGGFNNTYGNVEVITGRLQGDYQFQPFTVGVRYAGLLLDSKMGYMKPAAGGGTFYNAGLGKAIHEVTPSVTWTEKKSGLKLIAELPVLFNMPVYTENKPVVIGSYLFSEQPDQITLLSTAGNTVTRRTIPEAKLLMQFQF